jgi:site-specific DNA recombinase
MIASKRQRSQQPAALKSVTRCAIYTRKSTEEGLDQEFNSLDAQRESGEAYVLSQAHEGWEVIETPYDDGGFTGGNMDRPGLKALLADIEAGLIDCVIVYKVDRLSRSLLDFSRIIEAFDKAKVAFVSVTQQFNTANSMGRLMLNVLLSFAQFEREIISERTRDKIAAARRKGKWGGGVPVLGYDVDAGTGKLIVNEGEATRVRAIFEMYKQHQSIITTVKDLDDRNLLTKRWITKSGSTTGGKPFDKASLHRLLTNVVYLGKLRYKTEVNDGEQPAIVDETVWREVQSLLSRNSRTGGAQVRNQFGAILKGILRCSVCDCAMTPAHATKKSGKRYRYYNCLNAQKRGWDTCPTKSVPAQEIERFVVEQIRGIGNDPALIRATVSQREAR